MKYRFSLLLLLFSIESFAQDSFLVEGRKIKTDRIDKKYEFYADIKDSFKLSTKDSIIIFYNKVNYIKKTVKYIFAPSTTIEYYNSKGKDSVQKIFFEDGKEVFSSILSSYDSLDRIRTKIENHGYDKVLLEHYEYYDTIKNGRLITYQSHFTSDGYFIYSVPYNITKMDYNDTTPDLRSDKRLDDVKEYISDSNCIKKEVLSYDVQNFPNIQNVIRKVGEQYGLAWPECNRYILGFITPSKSSELFFENYLENDFENMTAYWKCKVTLKIWDEDKP